jgi:tRNA (adenine22-N1)-methyltransferase
VLPGRPAADIGTDHGLLAAYLLDSGRVPQVVASDLRPAPLRRARQLLAARPLHASVRRGDGLQVLAPGEVATVVIAGMGGRRIQRIVDHAPDVIATVQRLVLQPHSDWSRTRSWIATQRWRLLDEHIVYEKGEHHLVVAVHPRPYAAAPIYSDDDLELGPLLRCRREPTWRRWVQWRRDACRNALRRAEATLGTDDPRLTSLRSSTARFDRVLG